jgi:hypothetical protein
MIRLRGGRARIRRFCGTGCLAFLLSNKPSLSNRCTFPHTAARGRRRRYAICAAVLVGHRVTSSRSSSSVQRDMAGLDHGGPSAWCHACRFVRHHFGDGALAASAKAPSHSRTRRAPGQLINASYRVPRFCPVGAGADGAGGGSAGEFLARRPRRKVAAYQHDSMRPFPEGLSIGR